MSCEDQILECLKEAATQFKRIADTLDKVVEQTQSADVPIEPAVDDSTGSCPNCDSVEVAQEGVYPNAVYKCGGCQQIWINSENDILKS